MTRLTLVCLGLALSGPLAVPIERELGQPLWRWAPVASANAAQRTAGDEGATVWGTIKRYTDSVIVVDGKTYPLAEGIVIDTYSLEKDERGNVRLTLDARGRVTGMFFYGLDMPDVIRRYKM